MAEKTLYRNKNKTGEEAIIYKKLNEKTQKDEFFILLEIPEHYLGDLRAMRSVKKNIEAYNEKHKRHAGVVSLKADGFKDRLFVKYQVSGLVAYREAIGAKVSDMGSFVVDYAKEHKPTKESVKKGLIGLLVAATLIGGGIALYNAENGESPTTSEPSTTQGIWLETPESAPSTKQPITTIIPGTTLSPETTDSIITTAPVTTEKPEETIDPITFLETFEFRTYENYEGKRMIHPIDAYKIADACHKIFSEALKKYNESVPENQRYSYNPDVFDAYDLMARWVRESSLELEVDVRKGEDITKASDYNKKCRGPLQMSREAIEESNRVAKKIFGDELIKSEKDIYKITIALLESEIYNIPLGDQLKYFGKKEFERGDYQGSYKDGAWGYYCGKEDGIDYARRTSQYSDYIREELTKNGDLSDKEAEAFMDALWRIPIESSVMTTSAVNGTEKEQ